MTAADVLMWIGVGLGALIVAAWLVSSLLGRLPSRNDHTPRSDPALNPWGRIINRD